jgi:hypothetical protein
MTRQKFESSVQEVVDLALERKDATALAVVLLAGVVRDILEQNQGVGVFRECLLQSLRDYLPGRAH